jgi:hypothetical protein
VLTSRHGIKGSTAAGVQVPPKSSVDNHAERGKVITSPGATPGRPTARQAYEGVTRRGRRKPRPPGNREDRVRRRGSPPNA